jgi:hypothetical protein
MISISTVELSAINSAPLSPDPAIGKYLSDRVVSIGKRKLINFPIENACGESSSNSIQLEKWQRSYRG